MKKCSVLCSRNWMPILKLTTEIRCPKRLLGVQKSKKWSLPYHDQHTNNKNARHISNVVLSTEKSKWENLGSFIESKMSINKSGASRPRRRSTFWQGIEWDTPIKFKTIDLYIKLLSPVVLWCVRTEHIVIWPYGRKERRIEHYVNFSQFTVLWLNMKMKLLVFLCNCNNSVEKCFYTHSLLHSWK